MVDEKTFWWNLDPPQEAMREALENEGFPHYTTINRMPVFEEDVDMERVTEIARSLVSGTYIGPDQPKKRRGRKRG